MLRDGNKIHYFENKIIGFADTTHQRMPKNSITNDRDRLKRLQDALKQREALFKERPFDKLADEIMKMQEEIVDLKAKIYEFESKQQPSHKTFRRNTKKRSDEWVYKEILKIIEEKKKSHKYFSDWYLTKEDTAIFLRVKEKQVERAFRRLNQEGILNQPIHQAPHDTNREPNGFESCKGWMSDLYYIRRYEEEKKEEED